jgi:hypothetical protein
MTRCRGEDVCPSSVEIIAQVGVAAGGIVLYAPVKSERLIESTDPLAWVADARRVVTSGTPRLPQQWRAGKARAHSTKMSATQPTTGVAATAAPTCDRIGHNASTCCRYGGNDYRDPGQSKFRHVRFLSS